MLHTDFVLQTTRLYAPWDWGKMEMKQQKRSWHEIARPQVHGHDLNCLAVMKGMGNHQFVSGAEEKVARVFEAPTSFLKTLENIEGYVGYAKGESLQADDIKVLGANMSALGLSQKPIYSSGVCHFT
jgi:elongator complex protein 2